MLTADELAAIPLFATLPRPELEKLAAACPDIHLATGEFAVREGDERALFAVLAGKIDVVKLVDGVERKLGVRNVGQIFGEVPIFLGSSFPGAYRAAEPSRVVRLDVRQYHEAAAACPELSATIGKLARERIDGLKGLAAEAPKPRLTITVSKGDTGAAELRRFLTRNQISFDWVVPKTPEPPRYRLTGGEELANVGARELACALGLQTSANHPEYDTVIIGAGPAGLGAAVYGASEGLKTLVVEREAPGGQAGTSSRIENYLGFPGGVSGDELAVRALQQAKRLGAEILVTRAIERIDPQSRTVVLDGGEALRARTIILATGVAWRKLALDGFERFIGKGVFYGASRGEAAGTHAQDVHLIGAGNSAGQAALFFANFAKSVTLVVRGAGLEASMSRYLIEQLKTKSNIRLALNSEVTGVHGADALAEIDILDKVTGTPTRVPCGGLFVFIGADAQTAWLPEAIARDRHGYVLTGEALAKTGRWAEKRDPYLLETSVPGIFACGDVRLNPVKRVASAVGDGAMAIAFVHQYLAHA